MHDMPSSPEKQTLHQPYKSPFTRRLGIEKCLRCRVSLLFYRKNIEGRGMRGRCMTPRPGVGAQVSTSDNQAINVGTKVNAFVYNTLAQWYNEDAKVHCCCPAGTQVPACAAMAQIPHSEA